jgi:hypothetical protein
MQGPLGHKAHVVIVGYLVISIAFGQYLTFEFAGISAIKSESNLSRAFSFTIPMRFN